MAGKQLRSVAQKALQRHVGIEAQAEQRLTSSIAYQARKSGKPFTRSFATHADNSASAAGSAAKLHKENMLGPYATWGLAGAGAGLLFYFFAGGKSGGPIASQAQAVRDSKLGKRRMQPEQRPAPTHLR